MTFHFVCFTWVFFRSPSLEAAIGYFKTMLANPPATPTITWFVGLWMVVGFLTQWIGAEHFRALHRSFERWPLPAKVALCFGVIYVIAIMSPVGIPPFIYFQF